MTSSTQVWTYWRTSHDCEYLAGALASCSCNWKELSGESSGLQTLQHSSCGTGCPRLSSGTLSSPTKVRRYFRRHVSICANSDHEKDIASTSRSTVRVSGSATWTPRWPSFSEVSVSLKLSRSSPNSVCLNRRLLRFTLADIELRRRVCWLAGV